MLKRHFAKAQGEGHPVQSIATNTMMASLQQWKSRKF